MKLLSPDMLFAILVMLAMAGYLLGKVAWGW